MSLISWTLAGLVATFGALCYAEVGTLINKSGGEYPILKAGYKAGHLPAFMFAWTCSTILKLGFILVMIFKSIFNATAGNLKKRSLSVINWILWTCK